MASTITTPCRRLAKASAGYSGLTSRSSLGTFLPLTKNGARRPVRRPARRPARRRRLRPRCRPRRRRERPRARRLPRRNRRLRPPRSLPALRWGRPACRSRPRVCGCCFSSAALAAAERRPRPNGGGGGGGGVGRDGAMISTLVTWISGRSAVGQQQGHDHQGGDGQRVREQGNGHEQPYAAARLPVTE